MYTDILKAVLIRNHGEQKQHALKVLKQDQCDGPGDKGAVLKPDKPVPDARSSHS